MQVIHTRGAGLDVHKATVVACVMITAADGTVSQEMRTFGTMTQDLLEWGDWLKGQQITHGAMESTGSYWKSVYNLLEGQMELLVVNAQHIKAVPGRKTDVKDAEWIADLLRHGLLRGSFSSPKPQRELRELVRHRANLVGRRAQAVNELQRTLESTNIRLANVLSDITGVSATAMLQAILAGETDAAALAELAQGRLKAKKLLLPQALEGKAEAPHRLILSQLLTAIASDEEAIGEVGGMIAQRLPEHQALLDRLDEIPGVNQRVAQVILAEVGSEVKRLATDKHLISWAGVCPGNNQSGGKRRRCRIKPGNRSLRSAVVEAAHAASKTKDCYLSTMYRRMAAKRGKKRALIAVARTILQSAYFLIRRGVRYHELGADYFDRRDPEGLAKRLAKRIEKLGFHVALQPLAKAA